jgi:hypothetical protein
MLKIEDFWKVQKDKTSKYYMFIADVVNSTDVLRARVGRRAYQTLINETKLFLESHKDIVEFHIDTGSKRRLIRKGDCIAFVIRIEDADLVYFRQEWTDFLNTFHIALHRNECYLESTNMANEYLVMLEDISKNKNELDIDLGEDFNNDRQVKLEIDMNIENWLDSDYVKSELKYLIELYDWKINNIEIGEK